MQASNSIQTLLADLGDVISSGVGPAASPMERLFGALLSFNLVLWIFMPIILLLVLWLLAMAAGRMANIHKDLCRLTTVLGESIREQTSAIHHLRDKVQTVLESIHSSVDSHRDGVQQGARDVVKVMEAFDRHTQGGAGDIQKQISNIHDRLGKIISLRPGAELDRPELNGENP